MLGDGSRNIVIPENQAPLEHYCSGLGCRRLGVRLIGDNSKFLEV